MRMQLPVHSSAVEVFDCRTFKRRCVAKYHGNAFSGIHLDIFSPAHALFVKLERRSWFFDEAGWLEIAPIVTETTLARIAQARPKRTEGVP